MAQILRDGTLVIEASGPRVYAYNPSVHKA
jgi:hypothetical protein